MKQQKNGFSLVELLVVVIIIAVIAAIAIPSLLASRRAANQASAVQILRTIHSAQSSYLSVIGNNSTYGDFTGLVGNGFLDASFSASPVTKNTFTFSLTRIPVTNAGYCVLAESSDPASLDVGVSTGGSIVQGANGAGDCTDGLLTGITTVIGSV